MSYLKNVSNKIIGGLGDAFLPGTTIPYTDALKKHPTINVYIKRKMIRVVDSADSADDEEIGISDEERKAIAEAAVEEYKKKAEEEAAAAAALEAEIEAVGAMKKAELEAKAVELGVELTGSETLAEMRTKIISFLRGE